MLSLENIVERLQENEEIQRKFHLLESEIISILNFKDFFEKLLTEMMMIFHIPYVWMTLIKGSQLAALMGRINDSDIIRKRTIYIEKLDFNEILGDLSSPVLINNGLESYAAFFPESMDCPADRAGSLAITPVTIDGEIVGGLNQWDESPARFEPDMDTSFLEQLTLKISLCLSNVAAHEKLHFFAYHDPLTGLFNRRAFEGILQREFSRCRRHGSYLSLVFLDLDAFKDVNDMYGHDAGDMALKHLANALKMQARTEDVVARLGGDEFVVMMPETGEDTAGSLMTRVQECLESRPLAQKDSMVFVSISCGVASTADPQILTADHLLKKADDRLYAAKKKKKTRMISETAYDYKPQLMGVN